MTREQAIAEVFGITVEELEEALAADNVEYLETPYDRIIEATADGNPVAVERNFAEIMLDKIRTEINDRKIAVAANLFGYEPEAPVEEPTTEEDDDEGELDAFDFDDEFAELFGDADIKEV